MKKNVHIAVNIGFPKETKKADVESILKNLGYEVSPNEMFHLEKNCNFVQDIELDIKEIERYVERSELEIKNTLEQCNVKTTNILFFLEYDN